ncbi:hypothetical protein [Cecembia calidifontis]|nr:hypothetical protein [Cecembia calidifontis]
MMKKLAMIVLVVGLNFTLSFFYSKSGEKLVAQTNYSKMPTPKWCPEALMYATECSASGMGCQIVRCKKADT